MSSPPEDRFVHKLVEFCTFFKGVLEDAEKNDIKTPVSAGIMSIIINFIKKEDPHAAIKTFILRSHESWPKALVKAREYIINDSITAFAGAGIPEKSVESFKELFDVKKADGSMLIDEELTEQIWQFFHNMIKLSIVYVHHARKPDPETKKYTVSCFPGISIKNLVQAWGITSLE